VYRGVILLCLLVTPAAADIPSVRFRVCSSVESMLKNCEGSWIDKTDCEWINPPGKARGYIEMTSKGQLSAKKFEAVCRRVCAGKLTVPAALRKFCPPWWRKL
jgi:hypothetical protein